MMTLIFFTTVIYCVVCAACFGVSVWFLSDVIKDGRKEK